MAPNLAMADIVIGLVAIGVLVAVVVLRTLSGGKIEIKLNDAVIAAIAAGLALLLSGRITKLVVGTEGLTVETTRAAILSASEKHIDQQVSPLPVVPVEDALKGGVGEIPVMVARQVQGLDFMLGLGGYQPEVIQQYLATLTKYSFFRFIFLLDQGHRLLAVIDANELFSVLNNPTSGQGFDRFAALINRGGTDDLAQLAKLPGFFPASVAVHRDTDKLEALEKMEQLGSDWLPVIKPDGQLAGIVERSRLTSSMILDVANKLRAEAPAQP
jgi:hypothetical protein